MMWGMDALLAIALVRSFSSSTLYHVFPSTLSAFLHSLLLPCVTSSRPFPSPVPPPYGIYRCPCSRTSSELRAPLSIAKASIPEEGKADVEAGGVKAGGGMDIDSAANKDSGEPDAKVSVGSLHTATGSRTLLPFLLPPLSLTSLI